MIFSGRVVVPQTLVQSALKMLHKGHLGIVKTKLLARKYLFWIGSSKDIEEFVGKCSVCKTVNSDNQPKSYVSWEKTSHPFQRIHLDFFYFAGKQVLILVDSFSRFVDCKVMSSTTARSLILILSEIFAYFSDPATIVTDNGPPFQSAEFSDWCCSRKIELIHTPQYHPQSNGLAERNVQTVKTVLKKMIVSNVSDLDLKLKLSDVLQTLRNAPIVHGTSGVETPFSRIFRFECRNDLAKLRESGPKRGSESGVEAVLVPPSRKFGLGEKVYITSPEFDKVRKVGKVSKVLGKNVYLVEFDGKLRKFASNHMVRAFRMQPQELKIAQSSSVTETPKEPVHNTPETIGKQKCARPKRATRKPARFRASDFV